MLPPLEGAGVGGLLPPLGEEVDGLLPPLDDDDDDEGLLPPLDDDEGLLPPLDDGCAGGVGEGGAPLDEGFVGSGSGHAGHRTGDVGRPARLASSSFSWWERERSRTGLCASRMSCGVNEGGCGDDRRSTGPFGVIGADWVSGRGGSRSGFSGGRGDSRTGFCGGRGDVVGARDELGVASAWASRGATREATRSETARSGVERMDLPAAPLVPAPTGRRCA